MKTKVPETITCVNCNHNVVIKLYKVDTTINSSQGHFHTVYNPAEPAYTVYCINCGHFMTNDPDHAPPRSERKAKPIRRVPAKKPSPATKSAAKSQRKKKAVAAPVRKKSGKPPPAATNKAGRSSTKPAPKKTAAPRDTKQARPPKDQRSQRKKAK